MSGIKPILTAIDEAFAEIDRPAHFCNHLHCCECAERIDGLTRPQRALLAELLERLLDEMPDEIDNNLDADNLLTTIVKLRSQPAPAVDQ